MNEPKPDPHAGVGGAYEIDPKTGERRQVQKPTLPPDHPEHPVQKKKAAEAAKAAPAPASPAASKE